jgi:hypothetical protein
MKNKPHLVANSNELRGVARAPRFGLKAASTESVTASTNEDANSLGGKIQSGFHCEEPQKEDVMKRNLIGILTVVVMSLMVSAAYAQSVAKANVPFAFTLRSKQLPAGTYLVSMVGNNNAIAIRNAETSAAAVSGVTKEDARDTATPKLIFHRLAGQYFLSEIQRGDGTPGMKIPQSRQEKELEKELRASSGTKAEEVMVALN